MRIVEVLVAVNAACGIAAFLIARGAIRRLKRELGWEKQRRAEQRRAEQQVDEWPDGDEVGHPTC